MGSETALAVVQHEQGVGELMRRSTDVAGVCRDIVTRTAQSIQGRKYVRVEGWQSIAVAFGCVASVREVEEIDSGVRAVAEVRRMSDGAVLATAEGFVGKDEPVWYGGVDAKTGKSYDPRPMYAKRAMAQTRAVSRVCRSAFAFIVTLIDGNLSTTPAEEMDGAVVVDEKAPPPAPLGAEKLKHAATGTTPAGSARKLVPADEPPPHTDNDAPPPEDAQVVERSVAVMDASRPPPVTFRYGKNKGRTSHEVETSDLGFYISGAQKSLADPEKANFREKNAAELELLQAEQRWRGGAR